jgi:hypothetical protein
MSTLYYAGPLFTDAERLWNLANAQVLRQQLVGWTVLMPQEFCAQFDGGTAGKPDFGQVYTACLTHLDRADSTPPPRRRGWARRGQDRSPSRRRRTPRRA